MRRAGQKKMWPFTMRGVFAIDHGEWDALAPLLVEGPLRLQFCSLKISNLGLGRAIFGLSIGSSIRRKIQSRLRATVWMDSQSGTDMHLPHGEFVGSAPCALDARPERWHRNG